MKVSYFLRNSLLAESSIDKPAQSLALFCPSCGDIWGRVWVDGPAGWLVESVACEKHQATNVPSWGRWPGSFLNPLLTTDVVGIDGWPTTVEHLPDQLIKREFDLYMSYLDKELQNEQANEASGVS